MSRPLLSLLALVVLTISTARAADLERPIVPLAEGPVAGPLKTPELPALPTALVGSALPEAGKVGELPLAAPAATAQATPAQAAAKMAAAVTAQAAAGLEKTATAGDSRTAAANIQQIIEGGKPAPTSNAVAVADAGQGGSLPLAAASSERSERAVDVPAPRSDAKAQRKAYDETRKALAEIANAHGVVASLPMMPAQLEAQIREEASYKNVIFSDIDDTLDKFNAVFSPETVKAIQGLKRSGKTLVAITDRPDKAKEGSSTKSAFESFSSVPKEDKAGMILATNGGGKIYQFDAQGEPKLIYSEPELEPAVRAKVNEAAAAVKAEMEKRGVGLKADSPGPFGHSIIFTIGTKMTDVKELAHLMESEMKARGLSFEVEPREAKNPTVDPPYITFSKLNKSLAVRHVAELKGYKMEESVIIGDSMYKPNPDAKAAPEIVAEAERLSGQKIPLTGNMVDRNMELALPGALTLAVGGSADPRMANVWVMSVAKDEGGRYMGPVATREILAAMASRRRGEEPPPHPIAAAGTAIALIAMAIFAWGTFIYAMTRPVTGPALSGYEQQYPAPPVSIDDLFR